MDDLAALLGLPSGRAARRFIDRHRVPRFSDGRRPLVLLSTIIRFMKDREEVPADITAGVRAVADRVIRGMEIDRVSRRRR